MEGKHIIMAMIKRDVMKKDNVSQCFKEQVPQLIDDCNVCYIWSLLVPLKSKPCSLEIEMFMDSERWFF